MPNGGASQILKQRLILNRTSKTLILIIFFFIVEKFKNINLLVCTSECNSIELGTGK